MNRFMGWLLSAALGGSAASTFSNANTELGPNLCSFERMGAGTPSGWCVTGERYDWAPDTQMGPLGVGSARLRFSGKGSIRLESPARSLRTEREYTLSVWIRSLPSGALVKMKLRDNGHFPKGTTGALLSGEYSAATNWQPVIVRGKPLLSRSDRYYIDLQITGDDHTVWLDGLYLGEGHSVTDDASMQPKFHSLGLVLKPKAPWGLVVGQEPLRVQAIVAGAIPTGAKVLLRAVHTTGIIEDQPQILLDAQPVWNGIIEVTGQAGRLFGMTRLEGTVVDADAKPLSAMSETLLARVPPPIPGPIESSPFGIHVGFREPELTIAAKLGYKWCRVHDASGSTKWGLVERERGQWSWQDDSIALVRQHGLSILGLLDSSPAWASGVSGNGYWSIYGAPKNLDDWRIYVGKIVDRYAGVIDRWEVWNEPWNNVGGFSFFQNGNPLKYQELLRTACTEAKKANPKAAIVGIDTYPMQWDQAVLAAGAYPFYDVMSFHRYDHSLHARPNDAITFEANRLRAAQSKYGVPKPLELTEGGPDVALYHGSFFSFADASLTGDWQRGADQYARMFLAVIANGIQRFTAYSIHGVPRHGDPTHMMVEPGPLLRPLHLAVSALAQFVEGARYEERLAPSHDISAHVFSQPNERFFASAPSTVVALIANGEEPEPLPNPLPKTIRCFDRWGNPSNIPTHAIRGITYLVATGNAQAELREALTPAADVASTGGGIEGLLGAMLSSLDQGTPPLWTLLSSQGSLITFKDSNSMVQATRAMLRNDPAISKQFQIPGIKLSSPPVLQAAGASLGGWIEPQTRDRKWIMTFTAVPDGPQERWRLITLAVIPRDRVLSESQIKPATDLLRQWEQGVGQGEIMNLRDTLAAPELCVLFAMPNAQVLANRDYFTTMLHGMVVHGMKKSAMSFGHVFGADNVVTVMGSWEVDSVFMGPMKLGLTATLIKDGDRWKLTTLSAGPESALQGP